MTAVHDADTIGARLAKVAAHLARCLALIRGAADRLSSTPNPETPLVER